MQATGDGASAGMFGANNWGAAHFQDAGDKEKFEKLMVRRPGAFARPVLGLHAAAGHASKAWHRDSLSPCQALHAEPTKPFCRVLSISCMDNPVLLACTRPLI